MITSSNNIADLGSSPIPAPRNLSFLEIKAGIPKERGILSSFSLFRFTSRLLLMIDYSE